MTSLYHLIGAAHSLYALEFHAKDDTNISEVRGCTSIYQLLARGIKPHLASEHAWSGMNLPRFCEGDLCRRRNAARRIRRICETPILRASCEPSSTAVVRERTRHSQSRSFTNSSNPSCGIPSSTQIAFAKSWKVHPTPSVLRSKVGLDTSSKQLIDGGAPSHL